eukprot:TRINITY_DN25642_c0_g1_i1.p1 TRINITY_DN25642_c0_g1~~TRINITY_DN25642_c0_g1_i1.p1  ORF type:complete len:102 (-),score=8.37 TRINITY_DN25642_c0_g1_i1:153-458(-)
MFECICSYLLSNIEALTTLLTELQQFRICTDSGCYLTEADLMNPNRNPILALFTSGKLAIWMIFVLFFVLLSHFERQMRRSNTQKPKVRNELDRNTDSTHQ